MRTLRSLLPPLSPLVAFLGALACSQPGGSTTAPATGSPLATTAMSVAAASAAPAAATSMSEEPFTVQTEAFGDGPKAFEAAKEALLTKYYAAGLTDGDVYRAAVRGMVEDIDARMHRWNKLLSPAQLAEMETELSGEIVGIGVSIRFDDPTGHIEILSTTPGSPAEKAGLLAHDTIVSVNGQIFRGKTLMDAIHELRGKAGDVVALSVLRDDKLLPFSIARAAGAASRGGAHDHQRCRCALHLHVHGEDGLRGTRFARRVLRRARSRHRTRPPREPRWLVRRRDPHGGALPPQRCVDREARASRRERGDDHVEGDSSSPVDAGRDPGEPGHVVQRELLAGALAEDLHAQVVGMRTYGKWSVQSVDELGNGYAIKYTTALFHTPSGKSYDGVGLTPTSRWTRIERRSIARVPSRIPSLASPRMRSSERRSRC